MMKVQSSGSMLSASEVEPTMSAKMAVTGFRSPTSRALRARVSSGAGALDVVPHAAAGFDFGPRPVARWQIGSDPQGPGAVGVVLEGTGYTVARDDAI